jgi:endonuclease/exonuclease/phosphatase family metal-dependent hydrolase
MAANMRDITFATFNLHNLQLPGDPMYPQSRPYSEEAFAQKSDWAAEMLHRLDADVIAFQEVWSRTALEAVFERAGLSATHGLAFITEGAWDGVAVACAVRAPWEIRGVVRHKAFPDAMRLVKRPQTMAQILAAPPVADGEVNPDADPVFVPSHEDEAVRVAIDEFARSVLQVTVGHARARRPSVPPIEVFCTHLKSKLATPLDDPEYRDPAIRPHRAALGTALSTIRRVAEAAALRIILDRAMTGNDAPVVALGDFNDGQFSDVMAILSGQPSFRVIATSTAARRSDRGLYTGVQLQQLRSLADVYYTHEYRDVRAVIDHVLVSEQFYDWSERRLWAFREMRFYNDHVPAADRNRSDHGQVRCAFDWEPAAS